MINVWMLTHQARRLFGERLPMRAAWLLPRRIVYFAAIRLIAHATTGAYGATNPGELTVINALARWQGEPDSQDDKYLTALVCRVNAHAHMIVETQTEMHPAHRDLVQMIVDATEKVAQAESARLTSDIAHG